MERATNILIIDDEKSMIYLTRMLVLPDMSLYSNISVFEAETAKNALRDIRDGLINPDAIILDVNMPGMNGYEFLVEYQKLIRVNGNRPKIYIHSSAISETMRSKIAALGMVEGFFDKICMSLTKRLLADFSLVTK